MRRRNFLHAAAAVAGAGSALSLGGTVHAATPTGVRTGPPTITPDDIRFPTVSRRLRPGSAGRAGLIAEHVDRMADEAARYMAPGPGRPNPSHPGFVLIAARNSVIVAHEARGHAVRYESWDAATKTPVELPRDRWVPMAKDTLFDMASVSKLFTSTVATQLWEQGVIDLDEPVARYLPEFAAADPAKATITPRHLLTHRSGLVSWMNLAGYPDNDARMAAIYASVLRREPGSGYEYSDLNLITLGQLLHRVTGEPLDDLIADRVTGPLGMTETMFNPPRSLLPRIAATEYQPGTGRGMVHGTVHDENAWYLGGVAGHAGIFSTAADMTVFGQMLANGGHYAGTRVLSEATVRKTLVNHSADIGASPRGLGWQVDQRFYMDALTSPVTAGHTGYTGPCIVVDPVERTVFVFLANRVHPTRDWGTDSDYRRAPARALARAVPVSPATGRTAWFSGMADGADVTLTAPLSRMRTTGKVSFHLWYDTEPKVDSGSLEASTDGGSNWAPVPLDLRAKGWRWSAGGTFDGYSGRQWLKASAEVAADTTHLRWRYRTDGAYQGRGVYVDGIRVTSGGHDAFDVRRLVSDGWQESAD